MGWLYLGFVGTSIISGLLLPAHLKVFTPYTLLGLNYALRGLSGVLHAVGCWTVNAASSMPLLLLSRIVHGYTILLFPLSVVWIGARDVAERRATTLAARNAYSTMGIFLGIISGSAISAVAPTSLQAGAAPGYLNVVSVRASRARARSPRWFTDARLQPTPTPPFAGLRSLPCPHHRIHLLLLTRRGSALARAHIVQVVSLFMFLWVRRDFSDRGPIPVKPPAASSAAQGGEAPPDPAPWLHIWLVGLAQFLGWIGFVAIEGTLSLVVVEAYGLTHNDIIFVWAPTSAAMLLGTVLFSRLHSQKWKPFHITLIAIASLFVSFFGLYFAVRRTTGAVFDRSRASVASFTIGLGALLFAFAVTNTLFNALLMQHLKPHQQAQFQTPIQTLASVGRGIGPFLGTVAIAAGDWYQQGLGPKVMLAMTFMSIAMSICVPAAYGARFFDPPQPQSASML